MFDNAVESELLRLYEFIKKYNNTFNSHMKGDAQPLIKFFDGSDKRFIIPLYQRNYDWKEENCEQLFQDLLKMHHSDRKSHFFGSIVSSIQSGTEDRFIIDGQ